MKAYKAVSRHKGQYFSLGMASATVIPLPTDEWLDGGEHGFFACITPSAARQVIGYARQRKVLPIPPCMEVVEIEAVGVRRVWNHRLICDRIKLADAGREAVQAD